MPRPRASTPSRCDSPRSAHSSRDKSIPGPLPHTKSPADTCPSCRRRSCTRCPETEDRSGKGARHTRCDSCRARRPSCCRFRPFPKVDRRRRKRRAGPSQPKGLGRGARDAWRAGRYPRDGARTTERPGAGPRCCSHVTFGPNRSTRRLPARRARGPWPIGNGRPDRSWREGPRRACRVRGEPCRTRSRPPSRAPSRRRPR